MDSMRKGMSLNVQLCKPFTFFLMRIRLWINVQHYSFLLHETDKSQLRWLMIKQ